MSNVQQYGNSISSDDAELSPRGDLVAFEHQARFRRRKFREYNDPRCARAAELFEELAHTVTAVPDVLILQYEQVLDDAPDDSYHDVFMRSVAHRYVPNPVTAEQFIKDFVKGYKSGD